MSTQRCAVRILVMAGSFRKGSFNQRLADLAAAEIERIGGVADSACITDFDAPSFDQDVESTTGIPSIIAEFVQRLNAADAFVLASPEYNASMPGAVKNLIDWASRSKPQPFNGKQALLMSASPSMVGGNRGLWSLRIPLEHLGMRVYPDMFSLAQAHKAFNDEGFVDDVLRKRFAATLSGFIDLVEAAKHYPEVRKQWVEFLGQHPDDAIDRVETKENAA